MAASTYEEYFIRCPETQELVACRIEEFKSLLETMSAENALNQMDVPLYARDRFLHPNYVRFNMENREVIEGLKSVDAADIVPSQKRSRSPPVFSGCYDENVVLESKQLSDESETQHDHLDDHVHSEQSERRRPLGTARHSSAGTSTFLREYLRLFVQVPALHDNGPE